MIAVDELGRQLRTLDDLRAAGHLDAEEFAALRAKVLTGLTNEPAAAVDRPESGMPEVSWSGPTSPARREPATARAARERELPGESSQGVAHASSTGSGSSVHADDVVRLTQLGAAVLVGIGLVIGEGRFWPLVLIGLAILMVTFVATSLVAPAAGSDRSPEGRSLAHATSNWRVPVIVRAYANDRGGLAKANQEALILARHGYAASGQSADGGHVNLGRTVTGAVLTGGVSLLFGGSRTKGSIQVTFRQE